MPPNITADKYFEQVYEGISGKYLKLIVVELNVCWNVHDIEHSKCIAFIYDYHPYFPAIFKNEFVLR